MSQLKDTLDIVYSANNEKSVQKFNTIIESYLGSQTDTMELLDQLIEVDPEMPLAYCFKGYLLKLGADPRFIKPIQKNLAQMKNLDMNSREKLHFKALSFWADNQMVEATHCLEELLREHPKDMLALRMAHYLHFYSGTSETMRRSICDVYDFWQDDDPFFGYLSGMYAFALEESEHYKEAEEQGRLAIEYHNKDIWAAHAMAHVFQMQGRFDEGLSWISKLSPEWEGKNNFRFHLYWHNALFHLGRNELDAALDIYDTQLVDCIDDDFYLDVCNAAALLWRLKMQGVDPGDRWTRLQEISRRRLQDKELIFSTLHYFMTPALLLDKDAIDQGLASLKVWMDDPSTQGTICRSVGIPLANSLVKIGEEDFVLAHETLKNISPEIYKIGGSNAQRNLFTLLEEYCAEKIVTNH